MNKIYHIHTPKTGGSFVRVRVLINVCELMPEVANLNLQYGFHAAWQNVDDETYLVSSWREPAARTVSQYTYKNNNPTVDDFLSWFEKNKDVLSDYQSKNLLFVPSENITMSMFIDNPDFLSIQVDRDEVMRRIARINLFLRDDQFPLKSVEILGNRILQDFGSSETFRYCFNYDNDDPINTTDASSIIYGSLTSDQIDYLNNLSPLDYEIYNTPELFWDGK